MRDTPSDFHQGGGGVPSVFQGASPPNPLPQKTPLRPTKKPRKYNLQEYCQLHFSVKGIQGCHRNRPRYNSTVRDIAHWQINYI